MVLREWEELPTYMKCDEVKTYYDILGKKIVSLKIKRIFDVTVSMVLLILLAIPMLVISLLIKIDSPGPAFYRQERITAYGKKFRIHKFRTMVDGADKKGTAVTIDSDVRVTKIGSKLRNLRIDEIPQLLDVISGNMSFVGTRPEVPRYVKRYKSEWYATLLLPAGITSEASIRYKDEARLLDKAKDADKVYVEEVLPGKMKYNLRSINRFSLFGEMATMIRTLTTIIKN